MSPDEIQDRHKIKFYQSVTVMFIIQACLFKVTFNFVSLICIYVIYIYIYILYTYVRHKYMHMEVA